MEMKRTAGAPPEPAAPPQPLCPIVGVAASAGGIKALVEMLRSIPAGFAAAIAVVQHRSSDPTSILVEVLRVHSPLPVKTAQDGEPVAPATVYVCPAGMHMTAGRVLRLVESERLNYVRPSADLMFVSLAQAYGRRAIGVVLSGMGTDGAIGCKMIVDAGGTVIAQDPASAGFPQMPSAAAALGPAQLVLPPDEIGRALVQVLKRLEQEGDDATSTSPLGASNPTAMKVLLVDDHRMVLEGLRVLLNGERDFFVLARDAEDGRAAVRLSAELNPDVVVMDLAMPGLDGVAATRQILAQNPAVRVIALSAHTDARTTQRALRAGALAVVSKQKAFDELPAAIRSVTSGHRYVSRRGLPAAETLILPATSPASTNRTNSTRP
jgi:two-component system chemotaxis response regulator CheB